MSTTMAINRVFSALRCSHTSMYAALWCSKIGNFWFAIAKYKQPLIISLLLSLSGCTFIGDQEAPVVEGFGRSSSLVTSKKKPAGAYWVKRGDTLYSIAWAHNLDYRTLAEMNQLRSPYRIYAGQYLRTQRGFFESLGRIFKQNSSPLPVQAKRPSRRPAMIVQKKRPIVARKSARFEVLTPRKVAPAQKRAVKTVTLLSRDSTKFIPVKGWRWPAHGKIAQGYSSQAGGNKGIDIAGSYGSAVQAAAAGKVVYSGSGLKGYGQLLLIKHNNSFLSAYAHNKRLLVKEGDQVVAGQKIAEMGRANHGFTRLHFEIRRNGQPVDPMIYLSSKPLK